MNRPMMIVAAGLVGVLFGLGLIKAPYLEGIFCNKSLLMLKALSIMQATAGSPSILTTEWPWQKYLQQIMSLQEKRQFRLVKSRFLS